MSESFQSRSDLVSRQFAEPLQVLQPNQIIGRFMLVKFLGEGGMGSVWSAEDPTRKDERNDGLVVLKFLRDDIRRCPEAVADFQAAYRRTQKLIHQHICPLLDLANDPVHGEFQVMPFARGKTLLQLMKRLDPNRTGIPVDQVAKLLRPVARALDYAHQEGIVHRDIKPGNIMVELRDGKITKVFVVDFGLAAEVRTSMSMHSRSVMQVSGTEPYMAPEQWMGQTQDGRGDQYSLGVVAWEMLTGNLPYQGSGDQLGFAVTNARIPKLPDALKQLQPVFARAMHKDRKNRFDKVEQFIKQLLADRSNEPANCTATTSSAEQSAVRTETLPVDDLAALLQKTQESVARKHAQGKQLVRKEQQYAEAAQILQRIPEHLRDNSLFAEAIAKRDRVAELDAIIRESVAETRLDGLYSSVMELLDLQPHREDMNRLQALLPKESLKPTFPALLVAPFDAQQAKASQEAWAKHLGVEVEVTNSLGMRFRLIPPGTFEMGSPTSESNRFDDEYLHTVSLTQPKLLGVCSVTQEEWTKVMGDRFNFFKSIAGQDTSRFPVNNVGWDDCIEFMKRLNAEHSLQGWHFRLPTEAEWEYACRAGTVTPFWFGNELNGTQASCDGKHPFPEGTVEGPYLVHPSVVGRNEANPFGMHDQHGNVWEWCSDWYQNSYYQNSASDDPIGPPSGSCRVLRGGSWYQKAAQCRSATRCKSISSTDFTIGFRVICELEDSARRSTSPSTAKSTELASSIQKDPVDSDTTHTSIRDFDGYASELDNDGGFVSAQTSEHKNESTSPASSDDLDNHEQRRLSLDSYEEDVEASDGKSCFESAVQRHLDLAIETSSGTSGGFAWDVLWGRVSYFITISYAFYFAYWGFRYHATAWRWILTSTLGMAGFGATIGLTLCSTISRPSRYSHPGITGRLLTGFTCVYFGNTYFELWQPSPTDGVVIMFLILPFLAFLFVWCKVALPDQECSDDFDAHDKAYTTLWETTWYCFLGAVLALVIPFGHSLIFPSVDADESTGQPLAVGEVEAGSGVSSGFGGGI